MTDNKLSKALELVQQAHAERTDADDPYHGGSLTGKEKTAWAKVISNLKNLTTPATQERKDS